jgi:hypothetical protein
MGRPKGVVAQFVQGEPLKWKCALCGHTWKFKAFPGTKCAEHIFCDCKMASGEQRRLVGDNHKSDKIQQRKELDMHASHEMLRKVSGKRKRTDVTSYTDIASYTDTCTVERADKISMSITKFIAGCGLPFNIINSVFFIDMITDLNVVYAKKYLPKQKTFKLKWLPELFNDTFETVASYFRLHPGVLRTMGLDGYTTPAGHHVLNFVETMKEDTSFRKTVDAKDKRENAGYIAEQTEIQLRTGAAEMGEEVEAVYCGVVGDNVSYNRKAFEKLQSTFPKLFFTGCIAHLLDLVVEDICNIDEFKKELKKMKKLVKFVRENRRVKWLFKDISGIMLVLYSQTRFAGAALMGAAVMRSRHSVAKLIDHDRWREMTSTIQTKCRVEIEGIINDNTVWRKWESMMGLMNIACSAIHIVESQKMVLGLVYAMMDAITSDVLAWSEKNETKRVWKEESVKACIAEVSKRWGGEAGRCVSAKTDAHVFAYVVNPSLCPTELTLTISDRDCCERVLHAYYKDEPKKEEEAIDQFNGMLLRQGLFGLKVKKIQAELKKKLEKHPGFDSNIKRVEWYMENMEDPATQWRLFANQIRELQKPAISVSMMKPQSASVERVCKAHAIIHTKARNRLNSTTTQMLLYCYVNLRMMNKCKPKLDKFLVDALVAEKEDDSSDSDSDSDSSDSEDDVCGA